MNKRTFATAGLVALLLGPGCGAGGPGRDRPDPEGPSAARTTPGPPPAGPAERTFTLKGVVRKVDPAAGEVTVAHEALPGFMPAMTMPFTPKDRACLEDVRPGDTVEGPIRVRFDAKGEVKDYNLVDLTVTRPAPEEPATPPGAAPGPPAAPTRPGEMVPDFAVTTQDGATLRLSELRGEVVVLTFIYTRCPLPDFCPAMDLKFADLARRIAVVPGRADHVRLLSVSFDPKHDTPAVLAAHAARRGGRPPLWTFAVASDEELGRVAGPLGLTVAAGSSEIAHNLRTAIIGPDGRLARLEVGGGWVAADVLKVVYSLIPQIRK